MGFDDHLMPASFALVDETISIKFEGHALIIHHFESETLLKWEVITGPEKSLKGTNKYKAFEVRPGNFFIDFYKPEFEEHVSLILNRSTGQVIAGLSRLDRTKAEQRTTTELVKFRQRHHRAGCLLRTLLLFFVTIKSAAGFHPKFPR